jgi:hypothetical protein
MRFACDVSLLFDGSLAELRTEIVVRLVDDVLITPIGRLRNETGRGGESTQSSPPRLV